jgi:DNA-binding SARP family transcriptional activator
LRQALDPGRSHRDPAALLRYADGCYGLQATEAQLDLLDFQRLAADAAAACSAGDTSAGLELYERALNIWIGDPLANVDVLRDHPAVVGLSRQRSATICRYAEVACTLGSHDLVLAHLEALAAREPLNERAGAWLMVALAGTGQQAAALHVFEHIRAQLDDQLGVRPGRELASAHLRVLRQDIP